MFLKPHAVPERIEVSHRARDFAGHGEFFPAVGVPAGPDVVDWARFRSAAFAGPRSNSCTTG